MSEEKKRVMQDPLFEIKNEILNGFELLCDSSFPKTCTKCHRVFKTFHDLVEVTYKATGQVGNLKTYEAKWFSEIVVSKGEDLVLVNYMDCICGSTLCIVGKDRRGESDKAAHYRDLFDKLLTKFEVLGFNRKKAIQFLRKSFSELMQGKISDSQLEILIKEFWSELEHSSG